MTSPAAALADLGLTLSAAFVPFSLSRNKGQAHKSLNWKVTLLRAGKPFLSCDYSAGIAHCPGYAAKAAPQSFRAMRYRKSGGDCRAATEGEKLSQYRDAIAAAECESGVKMEFNQWARTEDFKPIPSSSKARPGYTGGPITPDAESVFYSVVMDSGVLDYASFAEWAGDYGYDTDSIKAKETYDSCLAQALALRASIGQAGLDKLQTAFQDY